MNTTAPERPAIDPGEWQRALDLLTQAEEIGLSCHVAPDGDALGSTLSLAQALVALGKRPVVSFGDDPFVVPAILRFLPGQELLVEPADFPPAPEIMVSSDASTVERLGLLADNAVKAQELIVIDHHGSNTGFGTLHLVDPGAAATAMLVEELIGDLGITVSHDIAVGLYVGLATDTGSFKYAATDPAVHRMAARLLETGIQPEAIARRLWDSAPFGYLQTLAVALGRVTLEPDAVDGLGLAWTTVTRADRLLHGLAFDMVEPVIDVVRRTEEAEVAAVLKEDDRGDWRVSVRSKGLVDVSRACTELGGGGHSAAAGFTAHTDAATTMARLRELLAPSSPLGE